MKIAIIGAGISGLYIGSKLFEKGHKVSIFERKKEIGNSACSGLFSERILNFIPESKNLIKNRIDYSLIHFPKKTVRVDFKKKFFVMDHAELDKTVAGKIRDRIVLNKDIKEIPRGFDRIIGADGPNSFVRKSLNLPVPKYRLGILGFSVEDGPRRNFVETWPVESEARPGRGFIWKIPRGDCSEYGILAPQHSARKLLFDFLDKNNIVLEDMRAKVIPQGFILPNNNSITFAGDAAGLTKPWSGGGVIWGLIGANILLKTFPDFKKYKKSLRRFFLPKIIISKLGVKSVYFFGFKTAWLLPKNFKIESDFLI